MTNLSFLDYQEEFNGKQYDVTNVESMPQWQKQQCQNMGHVLISKKHQSLKNVPFDENCIELSTKWTWKTSKNLFNIFY